MKSKESGLRTGPASVILEESGNQGGRAMLKNKADKLVLKALL